MPAVIARVTAVIRAVAARKRLHPCRANKAPAIASVRQPCCMSSTRKLARLAAPVVCAAYVTYVAIDRGYYHIERRKELDAATARAKAEAKRRVEADERR